MVMIQKESPWQELDAEAAVNLWALMKNRKIMLPPVDAKMEVSSGKSWIKSLETIKSTREKQIEVWKKKYCIDDVEIVSSDNGHRMD